MGTWEEIGLRPTLRDPFVTEICKNPKTAIHLSGKSQDLYPCENGVFKFSEFISRNSRVIEIYGQSDYRMDQPRSFLKLFALVLFNTTPSEVQSKPKFEA